MDSGLEKVSHCKKLLNRQIIIIFLLLLGAYVIAGGLRYSQKLYYCLTL